MFDKVLKYRGNVCIHDREIWRWRWRLWFSLFIASHESGQQQLEIQQTRTSTLTHHWSCWIAMEVIVEDQSIAFATVNLCIYNRAVCHYTIRDRMQMNWLKYSYSMHFLLVSVILFQVLVFFPPYLFIPRKRCKRRKKKISFDFTA